LVNVTKKILSFIVLDTRNTTQIAECHCTLWLLAAIDIANTHTTSNLIIETPINHSRLKSGADRKKISARGQLSVSQIGRQWRIIIRVASKLINTHYSICERRQERVCAPARTYYILSRLGLSH